jgi:UPF0042 nucleotide-binding protein
VSESHGIKEVVVISGASGSGRSTSLRALEDLGFFCMDNLPVSLVDQVCDLCNRHEEIENLALVIDSREGPFLKGVGEMLDRLGTRAALRVLWLDARDSVLLKRFNITQRRHPLGGDPAEGIREERALLTELSKRSTDRIDTSAMNPHELHAAVQSLFQSGQARPFRINIVSFGFKKGAPVDVDHLWDVRSLPNPYWNEDLRSLNGTHDKIRAFMDGQNETREFLNVAEPYIRKMVELAQASGKTSLNLGIGCTGGMHRSVFISETIAALVDDGVCEIRLRHRDLEHD